MSATLLCIILVICTGVVTSNCRSFDATTSTGAVAKQEIEAFENENENYQLRSKHVREINNKCDENEEICFTPGCIHSASRILKNMDPNVDPCDDFYKFVCGGFLNTTTISDDQYMVNIFTITNDDLQNQLKIAIEQEIEPDESRAIKLTKTLYKSCMDEPTINQKGLDPIRKILKEVGGWPVLEGNLWKADDFNWKDTVYKFRNAGLPDNILIDLTVEIDEKNATRYMIYLDSADLGLPQKYLSKNFHDDMIKVYYSYMVDVAVLLGAPKDRAASDLAKSLLFEIKLANISLPSEKRRNATSLYNPMSLTELASNYPSVPWREYFDNILPSKVTLEDDETFIVMIPSYMSNLEKLLTNTPKKTQANYLMWRAVFASASCLNDNIRSRQLKFLATLIGTTKREPRWKECMTMISEKVPIGIGTMYVRKYFNEAAKQNVADVVTEILQQVKNTLKTVEWMDDKTRLRALEKAGAITSLIGYADELMDDSKLDELFETLELSEGSYFENILNLTLFNNDYSRNQLRKTVNKADMVYQGNPATVNAFYSPQRNNIQLPAGILQGGFFSSDYPKYMNYGAIGSIISHEITHGFDDQGRQFNKDGNIADWWEPSTNEKFLQRAQCIINQYGNYTIDDINANVNGIITQGENIADIGGAKIVYLAYDNWASRHPIEKKLPGLPYTPKQLLWINQASVSCSKFTPEVRAFLAASDEHSPTEFRVLGPLSNIPQFSENFNCPIGSKMNPKDKCSVW